MPRINFTFTKNILDAYYPPEEFVLGIAYAPLGYGKSSYLFKVTIEALMRVYHLSEKEAWEVLKTIIMFHPEQFFDKLDQAEEYGFYKLLILNWEDAGLWLNAMDWDDPFILSLTKWLNVARTDCTALLCSSPSVNMVFRKLREFPSIITLRITKYGSSQTDHRWRRVATAYRQWLLPDLQKRRVKKLGKDIFSCKMPNDFFKWYKPLRDAYAHMAKELMKEKWEETKRSSSSRAIMLEQNPDLQVPSLRPL